MKRFATAAVLLSTLTWGVRPAAAADWYQPAPPPNRHNDVLKNVVIGIGLVGLGYVAAKALSPQPNYGPAYVPQPNYGVQLGYGPGNGGSYGAGYGYGANYGGGSSCGPVPPRPQHYESHHHGSSHHGDYYRSQYFGPNGRF